MMKRVVAFLIITTMMSLSAYAQSKDIFKEPAQSNKKDKSTEYKINGFLSDLPAFFVLVPDRRSVSLNFIKSGGKPVTLKLFNNVNGWLSDSGIVVSSGKSDFGIIIDFTTGKIHQMPKDDVPKYLSRFSFRDALYIEDVSSLNKDPNISANVAIVDASGNYSKDEMRFFPVVNIRNVAKIDKSVSAVDNRPVLGSSQKQMDSRNHIVVGRPIITAAANGQLDRLSKLIESGTVDINEVDEITGDNALIRSLKAGAEESANLLIEKGININHINKSGQSALHIASDIGLYEISKKVIELGANINLRDKSGNTPIITASLAPNAYLTDLLIKSGANVNDVNLDGETPLTVAVSAGNTNTMNILIENGAKLDVKDKNNNDLLMKAVSESNERTVKRLIYYGLKPDRKNNFGVTALHIAISKENINIINDLLQAGADINLQDFEGNTPLIIAVSNGNIPIVEVLLTYKPNILIVNKSDKSAYNIAKEKGFKHIEGLLGQNLEKFDIATNELFDLVNRNDIQGTELAIMRGARVDIVEPSTGNTPIFTAVANNEKFMVSKLIELGSNVNHQNVKGNTPLIIAVNSANDDIVKMLLDAKADPNIKNQSGDTALIWATKLKRVDKVRELLLAGADPNIKNNDGFSAYQIAFNEGPEEVLGLLQSAGARR